ncbi:MAG: hypothetical protein Q8P67_00795 [archaeon]|nr:hypothetical protein [archaeon]
MAAESSKEIPGKGECAGHVRVGERQHFLPWLVNPGEEEAAAAEWWRAGRRMALGMACAEQNRNHLFALVKKAILITSE